jgi:lipoyl(octanoyl) transferase
MPADETSRTLLVADLGRTDYRWCWNLQHHVLEARRKGRGGDLLLLTEHDHVYTIGRTGNADHLLAKNEELKSRGIDLCFSDRGGDITYHGPGQLVGYPILDLNGYYRDLHRYLRDLEEVVIRTLVHLGIRAKRLSGYTGVWVESEKICAIGIRSSRWLTMHGFALNVHTDLTYFQRIIPCGIFERGVTSLQEVLGRPMGINEVGHLLVEEFAHVFGVEIQSVSMNNLLEVIAPIALDIARDQRHAGLLVEHLEKEDA